MFHGISVYLGQQAKRACSEERHFYVVNFCRARGMLYMFGTGRVGTVSVLISQELFGALHRTNSSGPPECKEFSKGRGALEFFHVAFRDVVR